MLRRNPKPLGSLVRLEELDALIRRSRASRIAAAGIAVVAYPALLIGAWITGPFTPADHWYPVECFAMVAALVPLTGFSVRLTRVLAGSAELPTLDEARLQLMERVRASRLPIEVCTDCLIVLTGMPGECAQCGKRFAVMRVGGDTEIRRLEALVGAPKRPVTSLDRS